MKCKYIFFLLFCFLFIVILAANLNSEKISKNNNLSIQKESNSFFEVISISDNEIIINFKLQSYFFEDSSLDGFKRIIVESDAYTHEEGLPSLPFFTKVFGVPEDGNIIVSLTDVVSKKINNIKIEPTKTTELKNRENVFKEQTEDLPEISYTYSPNQIFYNNGGYYPESVLNTIEPAFAGFQKIQSFVFYPFQFTGKNNSLNIIEQARIVVNITGNKKKNYQNFSNNRYNSFLGDLLVNYDNAKYWEKEETSSRNSSYNYTPRYSDPVLVSEIDIRIIDDGIYKVTYEDLKHQMRVMRDSLNVNFTWNIDYINPKLLELTNNGMPVPLHFVGENDNSFDPGDYFEFWGEHIKGKESYYNPHTNKNVYKLKLLNQIGTRMAVENGGLHFEASQVIVPDGYQQTVHFERQVFSDRLGYQVEQGNIFFHKEDVLFWKPITAPDLSITPFELEYPLSVNTRYFNAKVSIWGASYLENVVNDHHAIVRINSALINSHRWTNQTEKIFENASSMANSYLFHGINNLFIDMPGDTPMGYLEQIFLDYFQITYWREYKTDSDFLKFNKPSNRPFGLYQFELQNFSDEQVFVYKIGSSIFNNITVEPLTDMGLPPYTIKFQDNIITDGIEFVALTENMKKKPVSYSPDIPSDLKNPNNQAEYLIVTNTEFSKAEGTLFFESIYQSRGVNVKIIDLQDVYDEFNHGIVCTYAIKDFFSYAFHNWSEPRFSHVLLLGDGIFDKRNQTDIDRFDIVPIHNIWTYKHGATASDNWYACIIGDDPVADFHISRIPVFTAEQILPIAEKSLHYMENKNFQDKWHSTVTLAAGGKVDDATDIFAQQSESIRRGFIPDYYQVNRVYTAVSTVSPQYQGGTFQLKDRINDGTVFLQFMGHGGGRIWSDYNLMNANDIRTLSNQNYPFISSLSCFASAFDTRGLASIGEVFVAEPNKGGIAHIGFSGLGYLNQGEDFGSFLAEGFFQKNIDSFGAVNTYTKAKFFSRFGYSYSGIALTHGCVLFGDPMLSHAKPELSGRVEIKDDKYLTAPGDTLTIYAYFDNDIYNAKLLILNENEIPVNIPISFPVIQGAFEYKYVIPENLNAGRRNIKVIGSGINREVVAQSSFAVGNSIFLDNKVLPEQASENDSLRIKTKLFTNNSIDSLKVNVRYRIGANNINDVYCMHYNSETGFWVSEMINPLVSGLNIIYYFTVKWSGNEPNTISEQYSFKILAPDLVILNMVLKQKDNLPGFDIQVQNAGDLVSPPTSLKLLANNNNLNSLEVNSINSMQSQWFFLSLPEIVPGTNVIAVVNQNGSDFGEYSLQNNIKNFLIRSNFFKAGFNETSVVSEDNNLTVTVPSNFLTQDTWFSLEVSNYQQPFIQPDVKTIKLYNGDYSLSYSINLLNTDLLADTTGTFADNKRITLDFQYSSSDDNPLTPADENRLAVYRWHAFSKKWIYQGGNVDKINKRVIFDARRSGTYTVLQNNDTSLPQIDVNVEGQEFTFGGYISGKGVLSFLFSDANGIDIIENPIQMFINGTELDPTQFSISIIPEHTNNLPMKYHLNLTRGDYTIIVSCSDVNGNHNNKQFSFRVSDRFDLVRVANYPNPVRSKTIDPVNAGRTRFTYTLTDDADKVELKIYTVNGRLVKTFRHLPVAVGYHEFPRTVYGWDCRDEEGFFLANGIYFYKLSAKKGSKEITKTGKLSILK